MWRGLGSGRSTKVSGCGTSGDRVSSASLVLPQVDCATKLSPWNLFIEVVQT